MIKLLLALPLLGLLLTANAQQAKRQNFDLNVGNNGGSINGTIPIPCITGCIVPITNFAGCVLENDNEWCGWGCTVRNYTNLERCLTCLVINDEGGVLIIGETEYEDIGSPEGTLANMTARCREAGHAVEAASITATATTSDELMGSGPFTTSWTGGTYTLPVWTGLAEFVSDPSDPATSSLSPSQAASASASASASVSSAAASASQSGAGLANMDKVGVKTGLVGGVLGAVAAMLI